MAPTRFPSSLMPNSWPDPGVFKSWVSGAENTGQVAAFFNSELLTPETARASNATFTIYLRVHLLKTNSNDGFHLTTSEGKPVELRDWDDTKGEFVRFSEAVQSDANGFWDNTKFCLLPPPEYRGMNYPAANPRFRPNIDCRFKLVFASGPLDAHAVIRCFCPVRPGEFRSNAIGSFNGAGTGNWTCFDVDPKRHTLLGTGTCLVDEGDPLSAEGVVKRARRCNQWIAQEAVCHEVGHLLGMDHVGVYLKYPPCLQEIAKTKDTASTQCYEGPTEADTRNIMGAGMNLASWNVLPWCSRIVSHTGVTMAGWRVSIGTVPPRSI